MKKNPNVNNKREAVTQSVERQIDQPVVREERVFSGAITVSVIAVILVFNVMFYILASLFGLYFSPTRNEAQTLTGTTDAVFAEAIAKKKTVKIYFCSDEETVAAHDTGALVYETAQLYKERYPDFIDLEYINIITKRDSKGERFPLSNYTKNDELILKTSVIFECVESGEYKVVTDAYTSAGFADFYTLDSNGYVLSYDGEEFFASMISWVLASEHKKAYFTTTHGEQVDASFAKLLLAAGYETEMISLREKAVPDDADLLVISNPRSDFETAIDGSGVPVATSEIGRLDAYLKRGGNVYVSLDPYVKKLYTIESFLEGYGIGLSETEIDGKIYRDIVRDSANAITTNGYTIVADHADGALSTEIAENMDKYSDNDVIIREAGALTLTGTAQALLTSSRSATCENGGVVTKTGGSFPVAAFNTVSSPDGKEEGSIFVVSSIYMTVSDALVTNGYSNKDFIYSLFEYLYGAENMPYGCQSVLYDSNVLENLTMSTANLYTAIVLAVPAIVAILGAVVVIRRKNR